MYVYIYLFIYLYYYVLVVSQEVNLQKVKREVERRYMGCFKEEAGNPDFNARTQIFSTLTVEQCVKHCMPFQYAAIREG